MMTLTEKFEHLSIQLEAIKSATNNFAKENYIGQGGFGKVYKGELVLSKGQTMVALKRLDRTFGQGDPEFWKEIMMLSRYRHENIVSLLRFCDESGEKILVYEYAFNGSLDLCLKSRDLTWIRRLKICIGAARGLKYLHSPGRTQQRVLHRDIKSSNILLDENWNARISDFGLSKFGPANQQDTFLVSNPVGTNGYVDPQYGETGMLTKESDVYSFGVVLFEVLCGRLSIDNKNDKGKFLIGLVRQCYKENNITEIIYDNIKDEINRKSLEAFTTIAYQCLKIDVKERPLMTDVVRKLESALEYQEQQQSELRASSRSLSRSKQIKVLEESVPIKHQPFVQEDVLIGIYNDVFPRTAEQFFDLLLSDGSNFTSDYHAARKDTHLNMGQWLSTNERDVQVRKITFRPHRGPLDPPGTEMTEWQHALLSSDKRFLVFETVKQAHGVAYGSYSEVHCRWVLVTESESSCTIDVKVGVYFKKSCPIQDKIKRNAIDEYKKEVKLMLEVARSYINSKT